MQPSQLVTGNDASALRPGIATPRFGLRCRCGLEIAAAGSAALVAAVNAHLTAVHPTVAGNYDADDVMALAYRKPATEASR